MYMPYIKKLNENKFISMCEEYYKRNSIDDEYVWNVDHGVTPACLQSICMKYKISHYAYDIYNKCFLKNIGNRNYPPLVYYAINDHQYLIQNKETVKSLVEKSKQQNNINFSSSILEKDEKKNIFLGDIHENINVSEFQNYNSNEDIIIMYSRAEKSDISDILYDCI